MATYYRIVCGLWQTCFLSCVGFLVLSSCSISKNQRVFNKHFPNVFVGEYVKNASSGGTLSALNETKYFTPASTTKLITTYVALSYLPDTLNRFLYQQEGDTLSIFPLGDPSWYHPNFVQKEGFPIALKEKTKVVRLCLSQNKILPYAYGVTWEDANETYAVPYSQLCLYGNLETIFKEKGSSHIRSTPNFLNNHQVILSPNFLNRSSSSPLQRALFTNGLYTDSAKFIALSSFFRQTLPIYTNVVSDVTRLFTSLTKLNAFVDTSDDNPTVMKPWSSYRSQGRDTLLKYMLFKSDNFIANQMLLHASYETLGYFSPDSIISKVLREKLTKAPDKMYWVDGNGLSRYNQQTPRNLVFVLSKLVQEEKSIQKIAELLPTAGEGTLKRFKGSILTNKLFAKTGTMRNVMCLAGVLFTEKGTPLIFALTYNGGDFRIPQALMCAHDRLVEMYHRY